jgi:hypothetical protein
VGGGDGCERLRQEPRLKGLKDTRASVYERALVGASRHSGDILAEGAVETGTACQDESRANGLGHVEARLDEPVKNLRAPRPLLAKDLDSGQNRHGPAGVEGRSCVLAYPALVVGRLLHDYRECR